MSDSWEYGKKDRVYPKNVPHWPAIYVNEKKEVFVKGKYYPPAIYYGAIALPFLLSLILVLYAAQNRSENLFSVDSIRNWPEFLSKIESAKNSEQPSPGRRLWTLLPISVQSLIEQASSNSDIGAEDKEEITYALNTILLRRDFYQEAAFTHFTYPDKIFLENLQERMEVMPVQKVISNNRSLLSRSFPSYIDDYPNKLHRLFFKILFWISLFILIIVSLVGIIDNITFRRYTLFLRKWVAIGMPVTVKFTPTVICFKELFSRKYFFRNVPMSFRKIPSNKQEELSRIKNRKNKAVMADSWDVQIDYGDESATVMTSIGNEKADHMVAVLNHAASIQQDREAGTL